jgi:hypothetical protein
MSEWAGMQIPNGGYDSSWLGPYLGSLGQSGGQMQQAAEAATRPLNRMLEQVLNARLQEKAQLSQNQFASQQMEREIQARSMLQEQAREDQYAHEMLMAEKKRTQEYEAAQAMSQALYGSGGMTSAGGGVAPGTGPMLYSEPGVAPGTGPSLNFESVMGPAMNGGFQAPTPQQTMALGPQGVASVYGTQAATRTNNRIEAEQARNNAEQAQAGRAKAAALQQAFTATATAIDSAPLTPDLKAALVARAQTDPDGAAGQLAEILKPAPPRAKTQAEQDKDNGTFPRNFGGGPIDLPLSLQQGSEEYRVAQGAIAEMPADGKAALTLQAEELARQGLSSQNPMYAAIFSGNMPMSEANKPFIDAANKALKERTDAQFTLLAQSLGWKDDAQMLAERTRQGQLDRQAFGLSPEPPQQASSEAPAPKLSVEDYERSLLKQGVSIDDVEAMSEAYETGKPIPPPKPKPLIPDRQPDRTSTQRASSHGDVTETQVVRRDTGPEDALLDAVKDVETYQRAITEYRAKYGEPDEALRKKLRAKLTPYVRSDAGAAKAADMLMNGKW